MPVFRAPVGERHLTVGDLYTTDLAFVGLANRDRDGRAIFIFSHPPRFAMRGVREIDLGGVCR